MTDFVLTFRDRLFLGRVGLCLAFFCIACNENRTTQVVKIQDSNAFELELPSSPLFRERGSLTAYQSEGEVALAKSDAFDTRGNFRSIYGETRPPQG